VAEEVKIAEAYVELTTRGSVAPAMAQSQAAADRVTKAAREAAAEQQRGQRVARQAAEQQAQAARSQAAAAAAAQVAQRNAAQTTAQQIAAERQLARERERAARAGVAPRAAANPNQPAPASPATQPQQVERQRAGLAALAAAQFIATRAAVSGVKEQIAANAELERQRRRAPTTRPELLSQLRQGPDVGASAEQARRALVAEAGEVQSRIEQLRGDTDRSLAARTGKAADALEKAKGKAGEVAELVKQSQAKRQQLAGEIARLEAEQQAAQQAGAKFDARKELGPRRNESRREDVNLAALQQQQKQADDEVKAAEADAAKAAAPRKPKSLTPAFDAFYGTDGKRQLEMRLQQRKQDEYLAKAIDGVDKGKRPKAGEAFNREAMLARNQEITKTQESILRGKVMQRNLGGENSGQQEQLQRLTRLKYQATAEQAKAGQRATEVTSREIGGVDHRESLRAQMGQERADQSAGVRSEIVALQERERLLRSPAGKQAVADQLKLQRELAQVQRSAGRAQILADLGPFSGRLKIAQNGLKEFEGRLKSIQGLAGTAFAAGTGAIVGLSSLASPVMAERFTYALKDLGAVVGRTLLPTFELMIEKVRGVADWFVQLDPAVQRNVGRMIAFGTAAAGSALVLTKLVGGLRMVISLGRIVMLHPIAAAATVAAAAVAGLVEWVGRLATGESVIGGLVRGFGRLTGAIDDAKDAAAAKAAMPPLDRMRAERDRQLNTAKGEEIQAEFYRRKIAENPPNAELFKQLLAATEPRIAKAKAAGAELSRRVAAEERQERAADPVTQARAAGELSYLRDLTRRDPDLAVEQLLKRPDEQRAAADVAPDKLADAIKEAVGKTFVPKSELDRLRQMYPAPANPDGTGAAGRPRPDPIREADVNRKSSLSYKAGATFGAGSSYGAAGRPAEYAGAEQFVKQLQLDFYRGGITAEMLVAQKTADNTQRMADSLAKIEQFLGRPAAGGSGTRNESITGTGRGTANV
jgi:hypothetical protein